MNVAGMQICDTCGQRVYEERDHEYDNVSFPTTEDRLHEAEQCLLECGQMMGQQDKKLAKVTGALRRLHDLVVWAAKNGDTISMESMVMDEVREALGVKR